MGSVTSTNGLDTSISSVFPSKTYESTSFLQVKFGENLAFVYFSRPFPLGATVLSAKLRVRTYSMGSGTRTLTLQRVESRPTYSYLTWNNAPTSTDPIVVTKSGALVGGTVWEYDVTAHLQAVSDGAAWAGWRFNTDSTDLVKIYGRDGSKFKPELEVTWSDAPDIPEQLAPSGGRVVGEPKPVLRWDYTDVAGDTEMSALQVQIHSTDAGHSTTTGWATPDWDSGIKDESVPQLNLAATTYPGMVSGVPAFWSVRVCDGDNLWSGWSDPAEMVYTAKASFALISPAPGGTVGSPSMLDDATPVIAWALTGATQTAYRVRVWLNTLPKKPLWDSGRRTSADTSVTVPGQTMKWDDRLYRVQVDVWDDLDRQSTPGVNAAYSETTRALLDWDAVLTGTDWLSARPLDPYPFVELEWARDPAPDGWTITRDNEVIAELDFADTMLEDGTHRWVDRYAPPRTELRYVVRPRVNGKASKWSPPTLVVSEPVGIWLVNDTDEVCLIGVDEGSWAMGETSAILEPIRGDRVVQIRQGMRGYEGSLSGQLMSDVLHMEDVDARPARDAFLRIKRDGGATLTLSSLSFPVLTADMIPAPSPMVEEQYNASFSFWQRGRFDWDALG